MDADQRMDAYRRQTGRLRLTPRQMRQVMRMSTRQLARQRRGPIAATTPNPERTTV